MDMEWKESIKEKPQFNKRVFALWSGEIFVAYLDRVEISAKGENQKWYTNKDSMPTPSHWAEIEGNIPKGYKINN